LEWGVDLKLDAYTLLYGAIVLLSFCLLASNVLLASILRFISLMAGRRRSEVPLPVRSISIIVPAYNEEKNIGRKIDTLLKALRNISIDVEVLIGSDGSTDRTGRIVTERIKELNSSSWRLLEFPNEGKCSTLNKLVNVARGELIISTDADIPVPANSIEVVIRAFQANKRLGCVSCVPGFENLNIGSQKSYWNIEDQIRRSESALGRLIVVTGMLYAYKKEAFVPIPSGVMADDLWIPLNVLLKGFESSQIEELRVPYEKTDESLEIQRRKRVIVGGMDVVRRLWPRLITSPAVLLLVMFHKVNRWALPLWLFLFLLGLGCLFLWVFLWYVLGVVMLFLFLGRKRFFSLAYAGLTPVLSFAEFIEKKDFARWEHTRKN